VSGDGSFLARWSRRKAQQRGGEALVEPTAAPVAASAAVAPAGPATPAPEFVAEAPPQPTLDDVTALTHESDYSRFVAAGVDEGVKRAAMKKLFSDPRFNVMDGLDTYIDDYGKPDPIPAAMLRRMAQAQALRLFAGDEKAAAGPRIVGPQGSAAPDCERQFAPPRTPAADPVAEHCESPTDEDTALRLQPDDAAHPAGAGPHRPGPRS
jgi:hypothetical protein